MPAMEHELERTIGMISAVLGAGLVVYLLLELAALHLRGRRLRLRETRMAGLGVVSQGLAFGALGFGFGGLSVGIAAIAGAGLTPLQGGLSLPWWIYGLVVYEFWYWVQHWAAHKVRVLWCFHSAHHAPRSIHMLVGANHHFLESALYFPLFFGFLPALCGVHPLICVGVNVVDGIWGSFLHISDGVVRKGRYGWLERFLQTPSYHRVHHAKNTRYLDTNYNSITLLWDYLFRTLEPLRDEEPVDYGITREVDTGSFWDVHFGEFRLLWRDVVAAETWADRVGYVVQPPGWAPNGQGTTVADRKREAAVQSPRPAQAA